MTTSGSGDTMKIISTLSARTIVCLATAVSCLVIAPLYAVDAPPSTQPVAQPVKLALPSKGQLAWADLEFGMFIHMSPPNDNARIDIETDGLAECASLMGARYLLVVAKHNNGYLWWVSKTKARIGVQHNKQNQQPMRDILGELAAAGRKRGLGLGIYNVPADWGDGIGDGGLCSDPVKQEAFRKDYIEQVRELCSNYGPLVEYWFDGGIKADFLERVNAVLKELQPNVCTFNGSYNPIRWVGNEEGHINVPHWYAKANGEYWRYNAWPQDPRGSHFSFVECDTPGAGGNNWLGGLTRSVDDLMDVYYKSVGRGAQLVINVSPPAKASMERCAAFGQAIKDAVGYPLAKTKGVGDSVELDLGQTTEIDHVIVQEDLSLGQRILKHKIEGLVAGTWKELAAGENLGSKRIYKIAPIIVTKVRVVVTERLATPQIRSLYVTRTGIKAMDKAPPASPSQLAGTLVDGHTIRLTWTKPTEVPASGIARYTVYRGETRIGQSTATEYTDRGLDEQTAYSYTVTTISGCGLESARTASCTMTTPKDTVPPVLLSMKQTDATHLVVQFSEPVEETSATKVGNYRLDPVATVIAASRGADLASVVLSTSPLKELSTYTLTVDGVRDLAKTPMSVAAGSKTSLRCANDLLLYCPLSEGSGDQAQELVNDKKMKIAGTVAWGKDAMKALVFDGKTTAVDLGLAPGYDSFTIAVWVRPDRTGQQTSGPGSYREAIFSRDRQGIKDYQFNLGLNTYASPCFNMTPEPGRKMIESVSILKAATLPAATWTHLAVTRDAGTGVFSLYVDGERPPQHAQAKNPDIGHPYNPVANLLLGAQMNKNLKDLVPSFEGSLRDVRLYGRALDEKEIKDLCERTK
ncbi:MAG: alpha-L-fucosidase [bacterium]